MNFYSSDHMLCSELLHALFWGKAFDWSVDKMEAPQNRTCVIWRTSEPNNIWPEELKFIDPGTGPQFKTRTKFWKYVHNDDSILSHAGDLNRCKKWHCTATASEDICRNFATNYHNRSGPRYLVWAESLCQFKRHNLWQNWKLSAD